ncbi:unnamed protein product [Ranitomeya imitator]|uniref:Uncharacterized protein n=1 Tax=Ranitomeya imitator TaxID=111125 RepID=A0ABN9LA56_9NEOB|nr:unnamed protein product [Ranitomeya imitator]
MSAARAKKVKMATKSCPQCLLPVSLVLVVLSSSAGSFCTGDRRIACPPTSENRSDPKRRRTERIKRERIISTVRKDLENRRRSRSNSQSDPIRRGRGGRPKTAATKKQEEEKAWRSGKDSGAGRMAARYGEDSRAQRVDRGSRRQQWMGEEKQEKEVDMYANLSDEKAFVFSVALAEINRKIINQRLIL